MHEQRHLHPSVAVECGFRLEAAAIGRLSEEGGHGGDEPILDIAVSRWRPLAAEALP